MKDFQTEYNQLLNQEAAKRKTWYSSVAQAYNRARPPYSKQIIDWAIELAHLTSNSSILEIGCGPGIATTAMAERGFSLLCLEPSFEMGELARQKLENYPDVEIEQTLFEEWQPQQQFDAVLAANSLHWLPSEVRYRKTSDVLADQGYLILFWNLNLQPSVEIYQALQDVSRPYTSPLIAYEAQNRQEEILQELGQSMIDSGYFKNLVTRSLPVQLTYSTDDYLMLLSSLSPYIALDSHVRERLFEALREKIDKDYQGNLTLSFLSAVQVAQKSE